MELRALTRRALSRFPEQCTEPASRRVGKAHARQSGTGLLPSLTHLNAHPGTSA